MRGSGDRPQSTLPPLFDHGPHFNMYCWLPTKVMKLKMGAYRFPPILTISHHNSLISVSSRITASIYDMILNVLAYIYIYVYIYIYIYICI